MSKFYTIIKKEENKYNFVEKINDKEYNKKGEITRTSYGLCSENSLHGIKFIFVFPAELAEFHFPVPCFIDVHISRNRNYQFPVVNLDIRKIRDSEFYGTAIGYIDASFVKT